MNLIMVRHGEIPANVNKVYAGKSSEGLTEKGKDQARSVAEKLMNYEIHSLYSSPIYRAIETARIIGEKINRDIIINDDLREMEMGPWQGKSESEIAEFYPDEWRTWNSNPDKLNLPGRETLKQLLDRVLRGLKEIYEDNKDKNVLIVTHVAIIRVLLLWHSKKSLNLYKTIHVPNAEIFSLNINESP